MNLYFKYRLCILNNLYFLTNFLSLFLFCLVVFLSFPVRIFAIFVPLSFIICLLFRIYVKFDLFIFIWLRIHVWLLLGSDPYFSCNPDLRFLEICIQMYGSSGFMFRFVGCSGPKYVLDPDAE